MTSTVATQTGDFVDAELTTPRKNGGKKPTPYTRPQVTKKVAIWDATKPNFENHSVQKAGPYLLGPQQRGFPVKSITQYVGRLDGTDQFYVLKIFTMRDSGITMTPDELYGKKMFNSEYLLLTLLKDVPGVVSSYGKFYETVTETTLGENGVETVNSVRRLVLTLDCYVGHEFSMRHAHITNMQRYVIQKKKLEEMEAIRIFYAVAKIVERLHERNIVHRDVKLSNISLNKETGNVTLCNFGLGLLLQSENELLKDQRGSPAYLSPELVSGDAYKGKPNDNWQLGILLYAMIIGQFPFYHPTLEELILKIKAGIFVFPSDTYMSMGTTDLIRGLLVSNPSKRLTASQAVLKAHDIIVVEQNMMTDTNLQVVPNAVSVPKCSKIRYVAPPASDFETEIYKVLEKYKNDKQDTVEEISVKHVNVTALIRKYKLDERQLQKIHAMYIAQKIADSTAQGKISTGMDTLEFAQSLRNKADMNSTASD